MFIHIITIEHAIFFLPEAYVKMHYPSRMTVR